MQEPRFRPALALGLTPVLRLAAEDSSRRRREQETVFITASANGPGTEFPVELRFLGCCTP